MKLIIALENKLTALKTQAVNCLQKKEGQNTIEYVLMLVVVLGVAGIAGVAIKNYMPELFDQIKAKISGGVEGM